MYRPQLASPEAPQSYYRTAVQPYRGVDHSVAAMRKMAQMGQAHPLVRRYAIGVVRQVTPKNYLSELAALYYDVCRRIRYTRDPAERELVQHPLVTLRERAGDCDDSALLLRSSVGALAVGRAGTQNPWRPRTSGGLGAAALSVGNAVQFVTAGFDPRAPSGQRYTHVFVRVMDAHSGRWVVVDPVAGPNTGEMLRKIKVFKTYDT